MYYVCIHPGKLLKVVSYYDLSVLSMTVMGFQKSLDGGCVGGVISIQVFLDFGNLLTLHRCR